MTTFNRLVESPYHAWRVTYNANRVLSTYQGFDWSQDGCSVPERLEFIVTAYVETFHWGSLRHDFMWRTLAVIDEATGRVWNERNRYRADRQIKADTEAACVAEHGTGLFNMDYQLCSTASTSFYEAIRRGGGARGHGALTDHERNTVDNQSYSAYDSGMKVMTEPNGCLYGSNPSNRCLPINYIQRNGNPFVHAGDARAGLLISRAKPQGSRICAKFTRPGNPILHKTELVGKPESTEGGRRVSVLKR